MNIGSALGLSSRGGSVCWSEKALQDFRAVLQVVSSISSLQHLELKVPQDIGEGTLAQLSLPKLLSVHLDGLEC